MLVASIRLVGEGGHLRLSKVGKFIIVKLCVELIQCGYCHGRKDFECFNHANIFSRQPYVIGLVKHLLVIWYATVKDHLNCVLQWLLIILS